MTAPHKLKKCADLFFTFFRLGSVSFGGGYAALPLLERELAHKRKWVTLDDLYDYYAVSQCTPGVIMVNVSTFVGYSEGGLAGAICGTAGLVAPSLVIICLIAAFLRNFADIPAVQRAFGGINAAVAALLTRAIWTFGSRAIKNAAEAVLCVASFAAMYFLRVNSALVILAGGLAGVILGVIKTRRSFHAPKGRDDGAA
ncbi:MAG: chromate transporter [Spirochaetaceae bacterium]|jgi:chromate transporter|nr:chromate transporter [Spirochaetaceae bacterium]